LPVKLCALAALDVSAKARIGNAVAVNAKLFLIIFIFFLLMEIVCWCYNDTYAKR
jgi:hypothetical protein